MTNKDSLELWFQHYADKHGIKDSYASVRSKAMKRRPKHYVEEYYFIKEEYDKLAANSLFSS